MHRLIHVLELTIEEDKVDGEEEGKDNDQEEVWDRRKGDAE